MADQKSTPPDANQSNPDGTSSYEPPPPGSGGSSSPEDNYSNPDGSSSFEPPPETSPDATDPGDPTTNPDDPFDGDGNCHPNHNEMHEDDPFGLPDVD